MYATILILNTQILPRGIAHGSLGRQRIEWMVTLIGLEPTIRAAAYELPRDLSPWFSSTDGEVFQTQLMNFVAPFSSITANGATEARLTFRSDIAVGGA